MKKILTLLFTLFILQNATFAQETENVFIVVIDGARYTETFGDSTFQNIPNMQQNLRPLGTLFTSFYNDGKTKTVSGHSSILSGTWQYLENDGTERPHKPTLFEYVIKQKLFDSSDNFVFHAKNKLNVLDYSDYPGYGEEFKSMMVEAEYYNDIAVIDSAKKFIEIYHPKLTLINLPQVDRTGHDKTWEEYLAAIKQVDSLVYDLWNFIESDSVYKNKTTLFITNDHGRHTANFAEHGDSCEGCRHVMGLMVGPETPENKVDTTYRQLIDIGPTIASLLHFEIPLAEGKAMEIFKDPVFVKITNPANQNFILEQNYPNPFNPSTTINFSLSSDGYVSLKVYDILGKEVADLVNENLDAGNYIINFNAAEFSSGIYFYLLKSGNFIVVRKMNLIK